MSELNLQLAREFFELRRFHVLTHWRHEDGLSQVSDPGPMLFIEHGAPDPRLAPEFLLNPAESAGVSRAVVEIRAWHADRFYPSVVEANPVLAHVAGEEAAGIAQAVFNGQDFKTILVISELPASPQPRERALDLLRKHGMDHVIEFSTMLADILERISAHGNYAPSQTLQTLRLLKRYGLIRRQQLEFPFDPPAPVAAPWVHVDPPDADAAASDPDDD